MRHYLLLLFLLAPVSLRAAGGFSHSVAMDPESRDSISVTSFIDNIPGVGFMPLKVVIDNRSTTDNTWSLNPARIGLGSDWIQASWTFPVKAGARAEFDILVPLKSGNFNYRWGSQLNWSGPGVDSPLMQLPQTTSSATSSDSPFIGLSDSLHASFWGSLQSANTALIGASLDLSQAPADWRAYIGLDQILITAQEWLALPSDKKNALLQSLALGSELAVVCKSPEEAGFVRQSLGLPDSGASGTSSLGSSIVKVLISASVTADQIGSLLRAGKSKAGLLNDHRLSGYLESAVAEISTAGPLVLLFIVLFGIIAGPVNLFVLAPAGRRHRLFITTPLISLAGAVILAAAIFIQDGTGGTGTRLVHAQLLPLQKQIVIQQEQASRTGLLFGSSFTPPASSWVQPLFGTRQFPSFNRSNTSHTIAPSGAHTGDWFRSRSRQNHLVTSVRPTRAAIEFTPGAQPSIVSSFDVTLDEILVRDPDGALWRAKNIAPGTRTTLTPATSSPDWWENHIASHQLASLLQFSTESVTGQTSFFYATAADPGSLPIETLPSIRWRTPLTLISGPLTLK